MNTKPSRKAASSKDRQGAQKLVAENRRARMLYEVEESVEAGLQLVGSEVKGLREGAANLSDAYAAAKGDELYLYNLRIGSHRGHNTFDHEALRVRKVLMHRVELDRWATKVRERGYSIIPLVLYFKAGRAKVELALCKGKTHEDRRQDIKERETRRELDRIVRRR